MEILTAEQGQIRKYLIGYSGPEEIEGLEERLLTDENFLEEFSIVKDELVDDYVSGALSGNDATRFETHFLSTPKRAAKVSIAKALAARAAANAQELPETVAAHSPVAEVDFIPPPPVTPRWQQYWPIAAGIAVIFLAGFVVWKTLQNESRLSSAGNHQRLQFKAELARLNSPDSPATDSVAALTLKPVAVRGIGEDRRVSVKDDGSPVLLQLELTSEIYESYQATLQTDQSVDLATIQNVKPTVDGKARIVRLRLPGKYLTSQGYQIKLSGLTGSGSYEDAG